MFIRESYNRENDAVPLSHLLEKLAPQKWYLEQVGDPALQLDKPGLLDGREFAQVHLDVVLEEKEVTISLLACLDRPI